MTMATMGRWIRRTLAPGALALATLQPSYAYAQTPPLTALYDAYVGGDHQAIPRAFGSAQAFRDARADLQRTLREWSRTWQPSRAAFLLELSFTAFERQWPDATELLGGTRNYVVSRRAAPGTNAEEDAFELAFHRAAVTFFLGRQALREADAYLTALAGRVDLVPATSGKPRLVDPWMTFARGVIGETSTAPGFRSGARDAVADSTLAIPADDREGRRQAELAIAAFERVKGEAEVAAEAAVRRGLLLLRLDRAQDALGALDEADAAAPDETVRYWSALFRGRALERLDRHVDAAAAYEKAVTLASAPQSAAAALASLWQRHDRPQEAQTWARRAMTTPAGSLDPWWVYWRGDLRHAPERYAALRKARP
jgi:tetratricopeptide (TPR) repeat protein